MQKESNGTGLKITALILILLGAALLAYRYTNVFDRFLPKPDDPLIQGGGTDEDEYPEAETSNTLSVPASVVEDAYKNEELSYIIYDTSYDKDCSDLWIQPRTEADNVRNEDSSLMKYDEDFFANFLQFDNFSFKVDESETSLSFDIKNAGDREYTGVYFSAEFYDKRGTTLYTANRGTLSLPTGETTSIQIKYVFGEDDKAMPVSFRLTEIYLYFDENDTQLSVSWTCD